MAAYSLIRVVGEGQITVSRHVGTVADKCVVDVMKEGLRIEISAILDEFHAPYHGILHVVYKPLDGRLEAYIRPTNPTPAYLHGMCNVMSHFLSKGRRDVQ